MKVIQFIYREILLICNETNQDSFFIYLCIYRVSQKPLMIFKKDWMISIINYIIKQFKIYIKKIIVEKKLFRTSSSAKIERPVTFLLYDLGC